MTPKVLVFCIVLISLSQCDRKTYIVETEGKIFSLFDFNNSFRLFKEIQTRRRLRRTLSRWRPSVAQETTVLVMKTAVSDWFVEPREPKDFG